MSKNNNYSDKNISKKIKENNKETNSNINGCRRVGRICNVQKNMFTILFDDKEISAKCKGSFYYGELIYPIVGDYVEFDYQPLGESRIVKVCDRKSVLKRPYPGDHSMKNSIEQEMVANVDYCFVVCSLNDNFNVNRIVRYISVAAAGNVEPVVVLTKADVCDNIVDYVNEVEKAAGNVKVYAVSAIRNDGMNELEKYCKPDVTIALMGSSGVGKSTLINALSGSEIMKTGAVRESDSKGRHTTTTRQLFVLSNGVTIVDTPGMRELGMCDVEDGIEDTFADIVELEGCCKFSDCKHKSEPGCAIKAAIADGRLTQERYELYRGLKNESERNFNRKVVALKRRQINKGRH